MRFDKTQSVLEVQRLISNLRQSSDEDVQDFFKRVSTCVMLSFKESIIDMKKEFAGGHIACIEKATKLMCEQIIKRLFFFCFFLHGALLRGLGDPPVFELSLIHI